MKTIFNKFVKTEVINSLRPMGRHHRLTYIFLSLCLQFSITSCFAGATITLNAGTTEPFITEDGGGFYGVLTREIFARMGMDAKVIRLPSARSIINANEGIDDGVIARTAGMEEKYKNLIRIPVSVVTFKFVAYSLDKKILVTGWDSFAPYSVGYIRGWRIYEKNITKAKSFTIVNNAEQLFRLLMNRRADLIMFEYYRGTWWNKHLNANAHIIGSPVAEKEMFIYMHKKHKDLIPKITEAFEAIKQDGTYQKIKDDTLPEYIE
jgi:polar amino acid transport system substrate-binding protein